MGRGANVELALEGFVPMPPVTVYPVLMNLPCMTAYTLALWSYCLWYYIGFSLTWALLAKGMCILAFIPSFAQL